MDNYAIADQFQLLGKLMDIHGENAFKAKSYSAAAFAIEKLPQSLADTPRERLFSIKGIGESVGKKVIELLDTGRLEMLQELIGRTPEGVLELMNIKGLGPKKIHTIWKEMGISTVEELEAACQEGRLAAQKGFGAKTEQKILEVIRFQQEQSGKYLYAQVEDFAAAFLQKLEALFPEARIEVTGDVRRQLAVVERLAYVTTAPSEEIKTRLQKEELTLIEEGPDHLRFSAQETLQVDLYLVSDEQFIGKLVTTSSSPEFNLAIAAANGHPAASEEEWFAQRQLPFIPAYLRENPTIVQKAKDNGLPDVVQTGSIKGLIHSHSNWSDGGYPIEEMAQELIRLGFEYLVISDHSKSAFYANGLSEERILAQHKEVDRLNKKLAPFRIFKSIECDILPDGSLDYSDAVLATFDLVIASIHSNLDMEEEKAMMRLMGAVTNPYTTILGHMTGRLLLKRKGYPVDHREIIRACARHHVAIEINAHPIRLDMDWQHIEYALEQGLHLSINPDAHTLEEFRHIHHGVLVAQKGGLTADRNLSSFSLKEFEAYLAETRRLKGFK